MEHEAWFESISAAVDGQIDASEQAALDVHLATCPQCTDLLVRMDRNRRHLRVHGQDGSRPDLVAAVLDSRAEDRMRAGRTRNHLLRRGGVAAGLVAAGMIALMALTQSPDPPPAPEPDVAGGEVLIDAQSHAFEHADVEVTRGTVVEWRNAGATRHELVRTFGGATVTEDLLPGRSEVAEFSEPGVYRFYCTIHPEMTGSVTVDA